MAWNLLKNRGKHRYASSPASGSEISVIEQIDRLIIFLIGRLTPQPQTQACRDYLERLLKTSGEVKLSNLCQAFCLAEYTLIHLDTQCDLGRKSLREMARLKFPDADRVANFEIVLVPPLEQKRALCTHFLSLLLHRLQRFFGVEQKSLAGFRNRIEEADEHPDPSYSLVLYQAIAQELYQWAAKRMGSANMGELYQSIYQQCVERYGILEESQVLLFLLQEELMTPYQLSLYMQLGTGKSL